MPMPTGAAVAAQIAGDLGTADPDTIAAITKICNRVLAAVQAGTVTVNVPGTGLVAPGGGGPVTGAGTGTGTIA